MPTCDAADLFDLAVIGAGLSGMAVAARLQSQGLRTIVLEVHDKPGGCAGYFERDGFTFDVGATTLVDFREDGVGGEFLRSIGMSLPDGDFLPGYTAWLPDRQINLYANRSAWLEERAKHFDTSSAHRKFWRKLDTLADCFWPAASAGISLPIRGFADFIATAFKVAPHNYPLARHLTQSLGEFIDSHGLRQDKALVGLLSMIVEDTLHARTIDDAPLINASMGATIKSSLFRAKGGMKGFWMAFVRHYFALGGELRLKQKVVEIRGKKDDFTIRTKRGFVRARSVVSTIPLPSLVDIAPAVVGEALRPYLQRDKDDYGAGVVAFLGVSQHALHGRELDHHQVLTSYDEPLGDGNNMFISTSAPEDELSAPKGYRSVVISTHSAIQNWQTLDRESYASRIVAIGFRLIENAKAIYPTLHDAPRLVEIGGPRAYARFARRPLGAVGGVRQTMQNSNQNAIPQDIGFPGFLIGGDYTWPGVGTPACVLGSRIIARKLLRSL